MGYWKDNYFKSADIGQEFVIQNCPDFESKIKNLNLFKKFKKKAFS